MSQQDVDLVLAFHAAYNERDVNAAADFCTADVSVSPDASRFPEATSFVGRAKLRGFLEETSSAWISDSVTPIEIIDRQDGRVLVRADWGGTGTASGVEMSTSLSGVYTVRDGEIVSVEWLFDHAEALKAAGLEESVPRENVEIVRRLNELFNAGDWDAALELFRPDLEFRDLQPAPDIPAAGQGLAGLTFLLNHWKEAYEDLGAEALQYIDADPWVIVESRWHGRGRSSGVTVDVRLASASKLADGKIVTYVVGFPDAATALADLGLE